MKLTIKLYWEDKKSLVVDMRRWSRAAQKNKSTESLQLP